jgi:hypothetical protein
MILLKSVFLIAMIAVAMIGVMVPSVSAIFPDPDKDPKDYLIRYYTEPKYQEWFDTNFPNESIEDKVGYSYKIITNDYYVSPFGFVIEPPKNWDIEISPDSMPDAEGNIDAGLIAFDHPRDYDCDEEYGSSVIAWYDDEKEYNNQFTNWDDLDLLYYFGDYPKFDEQSMLKITNESVTKKSNGEYLVRYDFTDVNMLPENTEFSEKHGKICSAINVTLKNSIFLFLQPNGEFFQFIYSADPNYYDEDIIEIEKSINTFYVGETELLSNIVNQQPKLVKEQTPEPKQTTGSVIQSMTEPTTPMCGIGTVLKNEKCVVDISNQKNSKGGGCLIATATYGSEMATEVQQLRELRDNTLLNTESGTAFMGTFNDVYYSFSPIIADYERENPLFKEAVKLAITPMISSLSLMETAESESEVLGLGLSVIMLNLGMYLGIPAVLIVGIKKQL